MVMSFLDHNLRVICSPQFQFTKIRRKKLCHVWPFLIRTRPHLIQSFFVYFDNKYEKNYFHKYLAENECVGKSMN